MQIEGTKEKKNWNKILIGWEMHCLYNCNNGEKEENKIKFKIYIWACTVFP